MPLKKTDIGVAPESAVEAIVQVIQERGLRLYGVIDHRKDIEGSGAASFTAFTVMFGSPQISSMLLAQNTEISIDMPLRLSVVGRDRGCRIIRRDMNSLLSDFQIASSADTSNRINRVVEEIIDSSVARFAGQEHG